MKTDRIFMVWWRNTSGKQGGVTRVKGTVDTDRITQRRNIIHLYMEAGYYVTKLKEVRLDHA